MERNKLGAGSICQWPFPCSSTQMPSLTQNMQHRSCLRHHSNGPAHEVAACSQTTSSKHLGQPSSSSPIFQELGLAHQGMSPHPSANPKPGHSALQQRHSALQQRHSALHRTHPCHWSMSHGPCWLPCPAWRGQRQSDWHS